MEALAVARHEIARSRSDLPLKKAFRIGKIVT